MLQSKFTALSLSSSLIQVIQELGYESPTPIQAQGIPLLLEGKDLIGQSKTGSGKTAAFAIPILEKLKLEGRQLQALILSPTRELSTQVAREIRKLGRRHPGLQVLVLSGGQPIYHQLRSLEKGVHVVVGTPGRILDHLTRGTLDLRAVATLVLDEADRMLEMGFQEDMERILREVPKNRQTVLFSATYPSTIESLSRAYQKQPVRVTIETEERSAPDIRQLFYEALPAVKFKGLLWLLQKNKPESAIIFCNLKATVIELSQALAKVGLSSSCLHGDLEQAERDRVMAKFRNQSVRILVATDVAARGIDIENLDAVINFDLPTKPELYVHRIGRTGRAGKRGLAVSLIRPQEKGRIHAIEKYTGNQIEQGFLKLEDHLEFEELREPGAPIIPVDSSKDTWKDAAMATLYIAGGRKDKLRPGDILGALTGDAGELKGSDIGKIEIHDRFSYVAVSKSIAQIVLQRLRNGRIKGRKFRIELVR